MHCTWIVTVVPVRNAAGTHAARDFLAVAALETLEAGGALAVRVALADARLQVRDRIVVPAGQLGVAYRVNQRGGAPDECRAKL